MKVYVHYEPSGEGEEEALTLKLTLPKKWYAQPVSHVLDLFLESYNAKKKPAVPLEAAGVHMEKAGGEVILPTDIVEEVLSAHADLYIKPGPANGSGRAGSSSASGAAAAGTASASAADGRLRCRNYGCNQTFTEAENSDAACRFHRAPPVFHDTKKGWSCCPKRVYDWDEFNLIEGCATGRHSTVDPKELFAPSPTVSAAARADANGVPGAPPLRSIEEYNQANPDAASAAKSAAASLTQGPACTRKADGTATCVNKGCQQPFVLAENHPAACCYHKAAPVFHDTGKFWACCPDKVRYDFDSFLKIQGCIVGCHCDGSPESVQQLAAQSKPREG